MNTFNNFHFVSDDTLARAVSSEGKNYFATKCKVIDKSIFIAHKMMGALLLLIKCRRKRGLSCLSSMCTKIGWGGGALNTEMAERKGMCSVDIHFSLCREHSKKPSWFCRA